MDWGKGGKEWTGEEGGKNGMEKREARMEWGRGRASCEVIIEQDSVMDCMNCTLNVTQE